VTKEWFDTEMPKEEPIAVSGSIESPAPAVTSPPTSQPAVILSSSMEGEIKKA
jgi:hypothetical protein